MKQIVENGNQSRAYFELPENDFPVSRTCVQCVLSVCVVCPNTADSFITTGGRVDLIFCHTHAELNASSRPNLQGGRVYYSSVDANDYFLYDSVEASDDNVFPNPIAT